MYLIIKTAHISLALISISFFIVRARWSWRESPLLQMRWVRIAPHLIDTLLLSCGIYLMFLTSQYPGPQNWLTAKIIALLFYIGFGTIAIKRGRTRRQRLVAACLATLVFVYILGAALNKSAFSWLAG